MSIHTLEVEGYVVAKARPRMTTANGKVHAYTPRTTAEAEHYIAKAWRETGTPALRGPVELMVRVTLQRPRGHFGKRGLRPTAPLFPVTRPDLDNYLKTVLDALNKVAWLDDSQVITACAAKVYGPSDCWTITVEEAK